jgi:phosphoglucosamine mutase
MGTKSFFGTDGIRGVANQGNITPDLILKLGQAAGVKFRLGDHQHKVIIGKDTRLSGYMIENALTAGLVSMGMDVILVGPVPTPAVAMLTKSMRADLGIMISASHNLYQDNGIKFFDNNGCKLSDKIEHEIEKLLQIDLSKYLAKSAKIGKATRIDDAAGRYIEYIKNTFPKGKTLDGLKIVMDCANGAAYKIGPIVLWELGAEVITIGTNPNGVNINDNVGSTHPKLLAKTVLKHRADLGIALDGDADRLIIVNKAGEIIDGDQLIATIASYLQKNNQLKGNAVVTTQMSNLGLDKYLKGLNLSLKRTAVGDRYVSQYMQEHGFNLGGEQSGHIILGDYSTTGDGLIAALKILAAINDEKNQNLKNLNNFTALPQILKNIKITKDCNLDDPKIVNIIKISEQELGVEGRILVRKSGTEPLVRIMVEGKKASEINKIANRIASEIKGVSKDTAINNPIIILKNGWKYTSNCWSGFWRRSRDSRRH